MGDIAEVLSTSDRDAASAMAHYILARERLIDGGEADGRIASDHLAAALRRTPGDAWILQEYRQIWSLQPVEFAARARADLEHTAWRHPEATELVRVVAAACRDQGDRERAVRLLWRAGKASRWADLGVVTDLMTLHWRDGDIYAAHQTLEWANRPDRCAGDYRYQCVAGLFYSVVLAQAGDGRGRWYDARFRRLARAHLLAAAALVPPGGDDNLVLRLAQALLIADEPAAAVAALERHHATGHWTTADMRLLAHAREQTGDTDGALAALDLLIAEEPTVDTYVIARAQVLARAGDAEAIAAYAAAYELRRRASTLAAWTAELMRQGQDSRARSLARKLHRADPRRYTLEAEILLRHQRGDEALAVLAAGEGALIEAARPERLDADYYRLMATAALAAARPDAAGHALELGLARHPADPDLLLARALWLADHGHQAKAATRLARQVLEQHGADPARRAQAEATLAWTYHRRDRNWLARSHMRRARRLADTLPPELEARSNELLGPR